MTLNVSAITASDLGKNSPIALEIVDTDIDLYHHMAWTMLDALRQNNAAGKATVFIVPVGPVGQYRRFTEICNRYRVSCRDLYFFNMDEYLTDDGDYISLDHPLSFRGFMQREYYERLAPALRPAPDHIIFPDPHNPNATARMIAELGGVQVSFGGIGINGHMAFNEPPEPGEEISKEAFKNLPTRVLKLARETRTINAHTAASGDIEAIPSLAVTVGMKEILSAEKMRFYMNRPWQRAMVRKVMHGPVTPAIPASFMQEHPDAKLTIVAEVAQPPIARLA